MIKIIANGLILGGAPLSPDQTLELDSATEASFVATGKATFVPVRQNITGPSSFREFSVPASIARILPFPDFAPSIVASFVAGTTATQSGTLVKVTATAHGIVGSTARNGWRIFWPGSPSIPAGWYQGFAWVDANTITFTNPTSQTVASESMNGGAAWTTITRCCGLTLPGNSVGPTGYLRARLYRSGGAVTASKFVRLYVGATNFAVSLTTTTSSLTTCTTTAYAANGTLFGAMLVPGDGAPNAIGNVLTGTVDLTQSQTVELRLNCGTAGDYIELNAALLEVCYG